MQQAAAQAAAAEDVEMLDEETKRPPQGSDRARPTADVANSQLSAASLRETAEQEDQQERQVLQERLE